MTTNERIKQLRQFLQISQAKFAKGISISSGYIAGIELGKRDVNDRLIKLICAVYGVSERWLKTGAGEMFPEDSNVKLEQAAQIFRDLKPEFQSYVIQQMEALLKIQDVSDKKDMAEQKERLED